MLKTISIILLAAALTGCGSSLVAREDLASALPDPRVQGLAGHWTGVIVETAGWYRQGRTPLDLSIAPDGTWHGTVGKAQASGIARMRGQQLVLSGTARSATGDEDPVFLRLKGDDATRWGETTADFPGGDTHASVSLRRAG